jgi:hypothetical protein
MPIEFTCPYCGRTAQVAGQYAGQSGPCRQCGQMITIPRAGSPFCQPGPSMPDLGDSAAIRMLLPVGRSLWAIAAGYFGLLAMLFFPAPIALVLGIVAVRDIRLHPNRHGMGRAVFGIVMGAIFSVGLVFVIAAIIQG